MSTLSGVSYGGKVYYQNLIPALAKVDKVNKYVIFIYLFKFNIPNTLPR